MRLYAGTSKQFIHDTVLNQIAEKLRLGFFDYYRYYPSDGEVIMEEFIKGPFRQE